jgi:DNA-binding transcriptional MocR family regulator
MPPARRAAVADIARFHGVPIIEDDAYGALIVQPPPVFAALAPDLTFHIAGLAKCLSPALRIAYIAAPSERDAARLAGILRATATMASPLTAAIATRWIEDGTAEAVRDAIRKEARARSILAARLLPQTAVSAHPEGFHIWLKLPAPWTRSDYALRLSAQGIGVVASDAFALDTPPEAVRLGLGAPPDREALEHGLRRAAHLLDELPALSSAVV